MEIREQGLAWGQPGTLVRLRFLDLHDQLGVVEYGFRPGDDPCACFPVSAVFEACPGARVGLHEHIVPCPGELTHAVGCDRDSMLEDLDLLWDADLHVQLRIKLPAA